ncbi:hypothetical protein Lser_V15G04165 [Lactuca serriola]
MPPRKRPSSKTNNPPPPPPPQIDPVVFQAAVTAAVTAAMSQRNSGGSGGSGGGTQTQNQDSNQGRRKEGSYKDFMNAKPTSFDGTGGVISLTQWFEKIESIFEICACLDSDKVKFAACTLLDKALTWWNGRVKSLTLPVANAMGWEAMKELLLAEYCHRGEMQKLEHELWNLKMKGSDIAAYTSRFDDLSLLYPGMVTPESKKIERFIWGLTQPTKGNFIAARPDTYDSAKCLVQILIDHSDDLEEAAITPELTVRSGKKRKLGKKEKSQTSHESSKRQQTVAVHAVTSTATVSVDGSSNRKSANRYAGTLPSCGKCNYHHLPSSPCIEVICNKCGIKGHMAKNCKTPTQSTSQTPGAGIGRACYGCGEVGHLKRNCPKATTPGNTGRVLAIGREETVTDPAVATGIFPFVKFICL